MTTTQVKDGVLLALGAVALYAVYRFYTGADNAINKASERFAIWWVGLDGHVEYSDFKVSRLWRDQFYDDWEIKPDVLNLYQQAYPREMETILDEQNVLKPQYREGVSG